MIALFFAFLSAIAVAAPCPKWSDAEAKNKIMQVETEVRHHDDLYFNHHTTEISDTSYDQLKDYLNTLQSCFPTLPADTPLQHALHGKTKQHQINMGSLNKAKSKDAIKDFLAKATKQTMLLQPKVDGIAIELVYNSGTLQSASTRGDGKQGVDITEKIVLNTAIPKEIPMKALVIIHGELFARLDIMKGDTEGYTSARHFVAGHINRTKTDEKAINKLDFFPWRLVNTPHLSDQESIAWLATVGFPWAQRHTHTISSIADIEKLRENYLHPAKQLPFLLDGIVIKLDSITTRKKWGETETIPHWALAWKFPAVSAVSQVENIIFTVGRSGKVTPVLKVKKVDIGRQTISSVSLGSVDKLRKQKIAIGDHIVIQLEGQATPVFNRVVIHNPKQPLLLLPDTDSYNSFSCLTLNQPCQGQFLARLQWLTGKHGLNLPHLHTPVLIKLMASGKLSTLAQLFELNEDDLIAAGLTTLATKQVDTALATVGSLPFQQRLQAISPPSVGNKRAAIIAKHYANFTELQQTSGNALAHILKSSEEFATTLIKYLNLPEIRRLTNMLSER